MIRWKFLRTGLKSDSGDVEWKFGEWRKHTGKLEMCGSGFHCSTEPYDAFSHVQGEIIAKVEVRGKSLTQSDKECWSEMRVLKAWKWTKKDSLRLVIYSAELRLPYFEEYDSEDKRPRQAIEASKKVLFRDTAKNREAAAWSAARAAWSAARAAAEAAEAAEATEATEATMAAALAAEAAAWAVGAAAITKIQRECSRLVKELKPYQENKWQ